MRWRVIAALALLILIGCSKESMRLPTEPLMPSEPSPQQGNGDVAAIAYDGVSGCPLDTADVTIIRGPHEGTVATQRAPEGCASDDFMPALFVGLPANQIVRLRASAPGYDPEERDIPVLGARSNALFSLRKKQS